MTPEEKKKILEAALDNIESQQIRNGGRKPDLELRAQLTLSRRELERELIDVKVQIKRMHNGKVENFFRILDELRPGISLTEANNLYVECQGMTHLIPDIGSSASS